MKNNIYTLRSSLKYGGMGKYGMGERCVDVTSAVRCMLIGLYVIT